MTSEAMPLEDQIAEWRTYLRRRKAIDGADVVELEGHLRDQLTALRERGLAGDEAFLVAVKRMGSLDAVSREFAREHSDRLWKQLVIGSLPDSGDTPVGVQREAFVAFGLATAAALAVKLPMFLGVDPGVSDADGEFYARNAPLLVLPFLALYFMWMRGAWQRAAIHVAIVFTLAAVLANVFPFVEGGDTQQLTVMHLPIALWFAIGIAYVGGDWFRSESRMDFVRFSGELAIYFVLIALGGGVFTGMTVMMFKAIGLDAEWLAGYWIIPCGAAGAVLVGSWLVEAKQSVIENMAPVLTRLFTPLFTVLLLTFLATMAWTGNPIDIEREVLIGFDLLLVLVVGLVLYAASARDAGAPPNLFDRLQLLLIASALVVDIVALAAIASRISEFGFTPNRVAALGENLILLVNLAWSARLYARFVFARGTFADLERWQIAYLPVFAAWAAIVVAVFPPLFHYR